MTLGFSKIDITPQSPVQLAGFAFRKELYDEIKEEIFMRTIVIDTAIVFVHADLIWWGREVMEEIKNAFKNLYFVFHATHSHSGPLVSNRYSSLLGTVDKIYCTFLVKQAIQSITEALNNSNLIKDIKYGKTTCPFVINRRKIENNNIEMLPNPNEKVNNDVKLFEFELEKNQKVLLINMACHPTISAENKLNGEYPGYVANKLERQNKYSSVLVIQGFCGDSRPSLIQNNKFYRGTYDDIRMLGDLLIGNINWGLRNLVNINICNAPVKIIDKKIELPLEKKLTKKDYFTMKNSTKDEAIKKWCEWQIANYENVTESVAITIQAFRFCTLKFIGLGGEIVYEYDKFIDSLRQEPIIVMGHTDEVIAYIPSSQQLEEGGYESQDSIYYFNLPARFQSKTENILKENIKSTLDELSQ